MKQFLSPLSIVALCSMTMSAQASQIWADGVSEEAGWIDYEKQKTNGDGDDNLCWAASASNIIDFWQQRYVVPTGTPTGEAVWEQFKSASSYDVGGSFCNAMQWWISGDYQGSTWTKSAQGAEDNRAVFLATATNLIYPDGSSQIVYPIYTDIEAFGGYYWDLIPETWESPQYININERFSHLKQNFFWWSFDSTDPIDTLIVDQFSEGMPISLSLASVGGTLTLGHAVTLWGVEYEEDENGDITLSALWLTDSDDYVTDLKKVTVEYAGETIYLTNYTTNEKYGNVYLESASGINISESNTWNLIAIPEPATATLSLLALAALAARRRRK